MWQETRGQSDRLRCWGCVRERTLFLLWSSNPPLWLSPCHFKLSVGCFLKWPCLKQDMAPHRYKHTAITPTWHTTLVCNMHLSNHDTAWIFGALASVGIWQHTTETLYHQHCFFPKLTAGAFLPYAKLLDALYSKQNHWKCNVMPGFRTWNWQYNLFYNYIIH